MEAGSSAFHDLPSSDLLPRLLAQSGMQPLDPAQLLQFESYLGLFLKWNAKLNLSAIREPEAILERHIFESIACARSLPTGIRTLMDFGSGGGLPGVPCAVCLPAVQVTLAESQAKKASFLREVVRSLGLDAKVHDGRVESMPAATRFDAVVMRAVDKMAEAMPLALERVKPGGWLAIMTTISGVREIAENLPGVAWRSPVPIARTEQGVVLMGRKLRP